MNQDDVTEPDVLMIQIARLSAERHLVLADMLDRAAVRLKDRADCLERVAQLIRSLHAAG